MAEIKTKPTEASVDAFLDAVPHPGRRADGHALRAMMERVTGEPATMWGPSIVGFGTYRYRTANGQEHDICRVGFSPRAANLVLYVGGFAEYDALLERLGKHKRSKACVYLNRLADVDMAVLEEMVRRTYVAVGILPAIGYEVFGVGDQPLGERNGPIVDNQNVKCIVN